MAKYKTFYAVAKNGANIVDVEADDFEDAMEIIREYLERRGHALHFADWKAGGFQIAQS